MDVHLPAGDGTEAPHRDGDEDDEKRGGHRESDGNPTEQADKLRLAERGKPRRRFTPRRRQQGGRGPWNRLGHAARPGGHRDSQRQGHEHGQGDPDGADGPRGYPVRHGDEDEGERGEPRPHDPDHQDGPSRGGPDERGEPRLLSRARLAEERHHRPPEERRQDASQGAGDEREERLNDRHGRPSPQGNSEGRSSGGQASKIRVARHDGSVT